MTCVKCSASNLEINKFCANCGENLTLDLAIEKEKIRAIIGEFNTAKDDDANLRFFEMFVKEKTDAYLQAQSERLINIVKYAVPFLIVIISGIGIKQYFDIKELQKKLEETSNLVTTAKENVAKSKVIVDQLQNNLKDTLNLNQETIKLVSSSNASILDSQKAIAETQQTLFGEVKNTANKATESLDEINRKSTQVTSTYDEIKNVAGQVNRAAENVKSQSEMALKEAEKAKESANNVDKEVNRSKTLADKVDEEYNKLITAQGGLKSLEDVNKELVKVKATEPIILRSHQKTNPIQLPDFKNPQNKNPYEFVFKTEKLKKQSIVFVDIVMPDGKKVERSFPISFQKKINGRRTNTKELLSLGGDIPFIIEVELVHTSLFAPNFVILTIRAIKS